jgi:hypothetical protein
MSAPEPLVGATFIGLGWIAALALPGVWVHAGAAAGALMLAGGLLYTAGAISYHRRWPDRYPSVFGYHEVFHGCVCGAAARVFDGHATTVISDGHVVDGALRQLGLRRSKPGHAVRLQNGGDISQVAHGSLEPGGQLVLTSKAADEAAPKPILLNSPTSSAGSRTCSARTGNESSIHLTTRSPSRMTAPSG